MKDFKKIPIVAYLESLGIHPVNKVGNQFLYYSPLSNENTPSFFVELTKNVFFDWSNGLNGDIIDLIREKEKLSFKQALNKLSEFNETHSFSFSGFKPISTPKNQIIILEVKEIQNSNLFQYINSRCIDMDLAKQYLKEVHYVTNERKYYALGFKNDSGGFELRNGLGFKGKTKNAITTIENYSKNLSLFEGFFDFLSALQFYNLNKPHNSTIILNTTNNLPSIKETVKNYNQIFAYLDNDKSGLVTINKLLTYNENTKNKSLEMYPNHKDFNHFLVSNGIK
ncbi:hypothetical protein EGI26_11070 [Lacihabitans sp. CCS-44]|uniref:toprim domain-containing protein n=1 Tax=Lacihabitans sp. CCS-44 TaxID=2487331 RepID=UPI0020CC40C3|nr:toprim domain-containing protein [Lacihabitans sp. CCS-44]MCP9755696.1 hypothetical protein [Lacihabitans sp. CCS-44]